MNVDNGIKVEDLIRTREMKSSRPGSAERVVKEVRVKEDPFVTKLISGVNDDEKANAAANKAVKKVSAPPAQIKQSLKSDNILKYNSKHDAIAYSEGTKLKLFVAKKDFSAISNAFKEKQSSPGFQGYIRVNDFKLTLKKWNALMTERNQEIAKKNKPASGSSAELDLSKYDE